MTGAAVAWQSTDLGISTLRNTWFPNPDLPSLLHLRGFWEDSDVDPTFLPLDLNQDLNQDRVFPPRPEVP